MKNLSDHIYDLVENGVNADAGNIKVKLAIEPDGILNCTIADDGCGIKAEDIAKLSDPFFTHRITRRQGLGLALIEQNSETCNGGIRMESELGAGSELFFHWDLKHIDCLPAGDLSDCFFSLMRSIPGVNFRFELVIAEEEIIWDSIFINNSIKPLSLSNQAIKTGVLDFLNSSSKAFCREWNNYSLRNIYTELK